MPTTGNTPNVEPSAHHVLIDRLSDGRWRCWIAPIAPWCHERSTIKNPYGDTYWDDPADMAAFLRETLTCTYDDMKERLA